MLVTVGADRDPSPLVHLLDAGGTVARNIFPTEERPSCQGGGKVFASLLRRTPTHQDASILGLQGNIRSHTIQELLFENARAVVSEMIP